MSCPVCSATAKAFSRDKNRSYFECIGCSLVFVPRDELISPAQEKARYDHHQNLESDPHYYQYLAAISSAICPHLKQGSRGLDFGCGRTTLLQSLFQEQGFSVSSYDFYYHPDRRALEQTWDFVILSEVIEHLRDPLEVMKKLSGLLKPLGKIFIKTQFLPEREKFDEWFYKRDITHVQFFNPLSLDKLAAEAGLHSHENIGEDLYLLGKD